MRKREEIEAELANLKEEAKRFNTPFFHHDEVVVRFAIRKLEWVLGVEEKKVSL